MPQQVERSVTLGERERQQSRRSAKANGRLINDPPAARCDLDCLPVRIGKVEVEAALVLGDAQVNRSFWRIELGPRFELIKCHLDGHGARGCPGRFVVGTPQEGLKAPAADWPSLTMAIDQNVRKGGADCGVEQLGAGREQTWIHGCTAQEELCRCRSLPIAGSFGLHLRRSL